jgi:hypothetical protein
MASEEGIGKLKAFRVIAIGQPAKGPRPIDRYEQQRVRRNRW